jgi:hypothetical protein
VAFRPLCPDAELAGFGLLISSCSADSLISGIVTSLEACGVEKKSAGSMFTSGDCSESVERFVTMEMVSLLLVEVCWPRGMKKQVL